MDQVEDIKKRIDIVEFVGQYLQLKKAGINYSACCPFHSEKTPSFMVSPERQSFKCFGCGEGGDVITFMQKMEGLSFPEALKILGDRVGIQVESRPKEIVQREKSQKDRLYKVNLLAAKYFRAILWSKEGKEALEYLKGRGLSDETIKMLKIGYAPSGYNLEKYFRKYSFTPNEVALAGHPERFRYRIVFPIFSIFDEVVGFSGRIFEEALPEGVSPHPKYLNTPETPIFHKSKVLYGLNLAKQAIRETKRVIVVEGQMDVASAHEAGEHAVVATSGTALTQDHLKTLGRYTPDIIFAFDEDAAGQKTAKGAVQMALELGLEPKMLILTSAKDIGELVQKDKNALKKVVQSALPPIEWAVKKAKLASTDGELSAKEKKELVSLTLGFISRMTDEVEKAHYVAYLSRSVGVPQVAIEKALEKKGPVPVKTDVQIEAKQDLEAEFISFIFYHPEIACEVTLEEKLELKNSGYNDIYNQVVSCYHTKKEAPECLKKVLSKLEREEQETFSVCALSWDQKVSSNRDMAVRDFIALKARLFQNKNEDLKKEYARKIAQAESQGDIKKVRELMQELQKNLGK